MNVRKIAAVLLLSAVLGTGGFFAGRLLVSDGGSEAQEPNLIERLEALEETRAAEGAEARFAGELLGIYLAPTREEIPADVLADDERLRAGGCARIEPEQAGDLDFPRPLVMPEGYTLAPPDVEGRNPWASRCGDKTRILGLRYNATGAEGIYAQIIIVRSRLRYDTQDVAASRVTTQVIGGREAIVILPFGDGLAQRSLVFFPESFGKTAIHAFNLSGEELLKVAEAVAEVTR